MIEKGGWEDLPELERLYHELIDYLEGHTNYPGWKQGVYPVREDAAAGIEAGTLYVLRADRRIAGTVILNHTPHPAYARVDWGTELEDRQVLVVHTLAVHPFCLKRGVGRELMDFAIQFGRQTHVKAIRLDVYEQNLPAIRLYRKDGFEYIDTIGLGYQALGSDRYELYQKLL